MYENSGTSFKVNVFVEREGKVNAVARNFGPGFNLSAMSVGWSRGCGIV
jgi:hypothetical protein